MSRSAPRDESDGPRAAGGPDGDLLRRVAAGDPEALDRWYRAEHPEVHRLCLGFLAEAHAADDLAQDAMLHLKDALAAYDARRPYRAWRTSVVLNLCRDRARRSSARRRAEQAPALLERSAPLPRPDEASERGEVRALLLACLERLAPREREVFVLKDLEELETARVAELCGIGESTVRTLLALARRRVRELVGPLLADHRGEDLHGA